MVCGAVMLSQRRIFRAAAGGILLIAIGLAMGMAR